MSESYPFYPPRRSGTLFHLAAILILSLAGTAGLWLATRAESGKNFSIFLIPAFLAVVGAPYLLYRLRGLQSARYTLERDGIHLVWGLRSETLPMPRVLWVRDQAKAGQKLPAPLLRWPGFVVGRRQLSEDTQIEYLAARTSRMVIIATPGRWFAISPEDPQAFLLAYRSLSEMGSLAPAQARSQHPQIVLSTSWADRPARFMALAEMALAVILFLVTALAVSNRMMIPLRLTPEGAPEEMAPAVRLFLLPVLNSFFCVADLIAGFFFYRRKENQPLAYLSWGAGIVSAVLFLVAILFLAEAK